MKSALSRVRKRNGLFFLWMVVAGVLALCQPLFRNETACFAIGIIFQAVVVGGVVLLLGSVAIHWLQEIGYERRDRLLIALSTLLFMVAGCVFIFFFLHGEEDIKTFGHSAQWIRVIEDRDIIGESILGYFSGAAHALRLENGSIASFPLLLASYLTGIQFVGFSQSIFILYYIPACFFLTIFSLRLNKIGSKRKPGTLQFVFCFSIFALCAGFLRPVLDGFVDVSGVLIFALLLNATLRWNVTAWAWKKCVMVALLILLMILFSRGYAFLAAGFIISLILVTVVHMLICREFAWKKIGILLLNLLGIIAIAGGVSFLAGLKIGASHSVRIGETLGAFVRENGLLWLTLAMLGAYFMLCKEDMAAISAHLLLTAVLSFLLFSFSGDLVFQYQYLLLPTMMLFVCGLATYAAQHTVRPIKAILVFIMLGICFVNFPLYYFPLLESYSKITEPFTTGVNYYPKKRLYYEAARTVTSELKRIAGDDSTYVYVIGDGPLNAETLKHAYLPEETDAAPFIFTQNTVDLRYGFPSKAFFADYLLVNKPYLSDYLQVQQVHFQLYDLIENDPLSKGYYEVENVYPTSAGDAILYKKSIPTDAIIINALQERLQAYYPDIPFVYEPDYFLALLEAMEGTRYTYDEWNGQISFVKEAGAPIRFRLNDTADFATLAFQLKCETVGLVITVENQDGTIETRPVESAEYTFDIAGSEYVIVTIADGGESAHVSSVVGLSGATLRKTHPSALVHAPGR